MTEYIYNGSQIIQEIDSAGTVAATYVYGLGIDEPIVMERNSTSYYYYLDGLGSVTEVADTSGNIIEKYKYDPFGETTILDPETEIVRDNSSIGNYYMYTGRQLDEETGLYYYRNRYYDTGAGRFITADPIGDKGGFNLYRYVNNNSINLIDPSGTVVRLCDVDGPMWQDILNFTHTFVEVYGRMGYVGSWGFYPRNYESKDVRDRVKAGVDVPGFVRRDDAGYTYWQRGMNYKCKAKSTDDRYDQCVKFFAESEADRYDLWFNLYDNNCKHWAKSVLDKCGVKKDKEDDDDDCPSWWPPCWFKSASLSDGGGDSGSISGSK